MDESLFDDAKVLEALQAIEGASADQDTLYMTLLALWTLSEFHEDKEG